MIATEGRHLQVLDHDHALRPGPFLEDSAKQLPSSPPVRPAPLMRPPWTLRRVGSREEIPSSGEHPLCRAVLGVSTEAVAGGCPTLSLVVTGAGCVPPPRPPSCAGRIIRKAMIGTMMAALAGVGPEGNGLTITQGGFSGAQGMIPLPVSPEAANMAALTCTLWSTISLGALLQGRPTESVGRDYEDENW